MKLPRGLAHFNKKVTNRIQGSWAWLLPPWAVIVHKGRKSGRTFRTPVVASIGDGEIVVGIMYGTQSDWVRNLLASGGGELVRRGQTYELSEPRVVAADDPEVRSVGGTGKFMGGLSGEALVARVGKRIPDRTARGFPA